MTTDKSATHHEFKAEVKQLLDILVHSLYTNREIFIRELVSNASDALDKLRFETTRGAEVIEPEAELRIDLGFDQEAKTLTITDTGVGLTEEELIANIGTIAHSGSAEFLKEAAASGNGLESIIGKFGVGFYSVFMAAAEVVIRTRSYKPGSPSLEWRSDGLGTYTLSEGPVDQPRGTTIEVRLKDEAAEFADQARLEAVIKRHSNFISFPIFVGGERVNTISALWREPKFNVAQEQYDEFYKFLTFDSREPLATLHISVDAPVQFSGLLYIPQAGMNLPGFGRENHGLDLYVRRVLIQSANEDILPEYLGFARGVVDSEDLPLNISRENLQENVLLRKIGQTLTSQLLARLKKMAAEEPEDYVKFWQAHGSTFKLGYSDFANHEKYAELLRFNSSKSDDAEGLVSLAEYVDRAKEGQKTIFYAAGPSREAIDLNPHLEIFKSKGLEVLYLFDPLDEFAMESLRQYNDFTLESVERVDPSSLEEFKQADEPDRPEPLSEEDSSDLEKLMARLSELLGEKVIEVRASARLQLSPCLLTNPDGAVTSSMEKILKLASKDTSIPDKVLEINPDHKLIRNLLKIFKRDPEDSHLADVATQLYESALLLEGYLADPHAMVGRLQSLLDRSTEWYLGVTRKKD